MGSESFGTAEKRPIGARKKLSFRLSWTVLTSPVSISSPSPQKAFQSPGDLCDTLAGQEQEHLAGLEIVRDAVAHHGAAGAYVEIALDDLGPARIEDAKKKAQYFRRKTETISKVEARTTQHLGTCEEALGAGCCRSLFRRGQRLGETDGAWWDRAYRRRLRSHPRRELAQRPIRQVHQALMWTSGRLARRNHPCIVEPVKCHLGARKYTFQWTGEGRQLNSIQLLSQGQDHAPYGKGCSTISRVVGYARS